MSAGPPRRPRISLDQSTVLHCGEAVLTRFRHKDLALYPIRKQVADQVNAWQLSINAPRPQTGYTAQCFWDQRGEFRDSVRPVWLDDPATVLTDIQVREMKDAV